MEESKQVEIINNEEPKQVEIINNEEPKQVAAQKAEPTVTIPSAQLKDLLDRLAKVEAKSEKGGAVLKAKSFNPSYRLPIWGDELIESVELIKARRMADGGKLILDQNFEIKLYGVDKSFTIDLATYGTMRKQVPAELISYEYKKEEFDSKNNPIVDKYKVRIVDWTVQDGKKIEFPNVPKKLIGKEFTVNINLINA